MTTNRRHRLQKLALKRELRHSPSEKYPLEKSPLFNIGGPKNLSILLKMSIEEIRSVATAPTYNCFDQPSKNPAKEARHIQEPMWLTLHLQYQFAKFLSRIIRPAFLHSATKKRSHITNAQAHLGIYPVICTDIQKFYENTTRSHVKRFLLDLKWPIDLAGLMANALTIDGHLPTGSAVSPILSYFTHRKLFAEIESICVSKKCTLTLFIDDITVSGEHATEKLLKRIKAVLFRAGLVGHKDRSAPLGSAVVITGAVRDKAKLRLRNKHRKSISDSLEKLETGHLTIEECESLASKIAAAKCVEPTGSAPFERKFLKIHAKQLTNKQVL